MRNRKSGSRVATFFVCATLATTSNVSGQSQPQMPESNRYGIVDDLFASSGQTALNRMREAGIGWVRYVFYWNVTNPIPGVYNWNGPDAAIAAMSKAGLNIDAQIMWPPAWTTGVSYPNDAVPFFCLDHATDLDCNDPTKIPNVVAFQEYVRQVVRRYKGQLRSISFLQEVHNPVFWQGNLGQYVTTILRPGYEAAKSVDPTINIVGPEEDVPGAMDAILSIEGPNRFCDVISFHLYDRYRTASGSLQRFAEFKPLLDTYRRGRPVWITESGIPSYGGQDLQADSVRVLLQGMQKLEGVDKFFLYRVKDQSAFDYGLLLANDTYKPVWYAVRDVIAADTFALSLSKAGNGSGTVVSAPSGISCGANCTTAYNGGTVVTLTATPSPGSLFAGWSGDEDCADGVVSMNSARACTAIFVTPLSTTLRPGLVDLNGDRAADVFLYNATTGARSFAANDQSGGFGRIPGFWDPGWQVYPVDLNGDGLTDVFFYDPVRGLWVQAINAGNATFTYTVGSWDRSWKIYPADLNGDGKTDIFVYNFTTGVWVKCFTDGAGGFLGYVVGQWDPGWTFFRADMNGDKRDDFFLYNRTNGIWVQAFSRAGSDGFDYPAAGQWEPGWQVYPADLNGDGRTDLFLLNAAGVHVSALSRANGGFDYAGGPQWDGGWSVYPTDVNGDGKTDLFLYNSLTGVWVEALSDGTGAFRYAAGWWDPQWQIYPSDLNGDGKGDLILYRADGVWVRATTTGVGTFSYAAGTWGTGWTIFTKR